MSYIIFSATHQCVSARFDGALIDIAMMPGDLAIPCAANADPNDRRWAAEAAQYDQKYALPNAIDLALERIDRAASAARARHITTGAGQETTYAIKSREADRFVAEARPVVTSSFIMLTAEADETGATVAEVADAVIAQRGQWEQLAAYIEGVRMGTKKAVRAAAGLDELQAALADGTARLEAL